MPEAEAEAGRRNEPMLTVFLPDSEAPLDEDEERPPSTESSSSKFLSGGGRAERETEGSGHVTAQRVFSQLREMWRADSDIPAF